MVLFCRYQFETSLATRLLYPYLALIYQNFMILSHTGKIPVFSKMQNHEHTQHCCLLVVEGTCPSFTALHKSGLDTTCEELSGCMRNSYLLLSAPQRLTLVVQRYSLLPYCKTPLQLGFDPEPLEDSNSKPLKMSITGLKGFILKLLARNKKTAKYGFISITSAQKLVNTKDRMMGLSMPNG